jgi:hypothetical protein
LLSLRRPADPTVLLLVGSVYMAAGRCNHSKATLYERAREGLRPETGRINTLPVISTHGLTSAVVPWFRVGGQRRTTASAMGRCSGGKASGPRRRSSSRTHSLGPVRMHHTHQRPAAVKLQRCCSHAGHVTVCCAHCVVAMRATRGDQRARLDARVCSDPSGGLCGAVRCCVQPSR